MVPENLLTVPEISRMVPKISQAFVVLLTQTDESVPLASSSVAKGVKCRDQRRLTCG